MMRCQRPERASFISTTKAAKKIVEEVKVCQRPERASFISTFAEDTENDVLGVNALNGLLSFLHEETKNRNQNRKEVSTP